MSRLRATCFSAARSMVPRGNHGVAGKLSFDLSIGYPSEVRITPPQSIYAAVGERANCKRLSDRQSARLNSLARVQHRRAGRPLFLGLDLLVLYNYIGDMDSGPDARLLLQHVRALVRRFAISERADVFCCGMTIAQAATLETLRLEGPL